MERSLKRLLNSIRDWFKRLILGGIRYCYLWQAGGGWIICENSENEGICGSPLYFGRTYSHWWQTVRNVRLLNRTFRNMGRKACLDLIYSVNTEEKSVL